MPTTKPKKSASTMPRRIKKASSGLKENVLNLAVRWSPTNTQALIRLATVLHQESKFFESEQVLKKFIKLFPHHAGALNLMADLELKKGHAKEAEILLEKAILLDPDLPELQKNLDRLRGLKEMPGLSW